MANPKQSAADELRSLLTTKEDLLYSFFLFLWTKGHTGAGAAGVRIPDTVIINHARVLEYFFTAQDGTVKKKSRANLSTKHLLEQLAKHSRRCTPETGVAAMLLRRDPSLPSGVSAVPMSLAEAQRQLTEGTLGSGTLQFFVEPKRMGADLHNACVAVQWTPSLAYMDRRANTYALTNTSVPAEARCSLDDGSPCVQRAPTVSSRLSKAIDEMCFYVAAHIQDVYRMRVAHMGLVFKVDARERLWLTYCDGIKFADPARPSVIAYSLFLSQYEPEGSNTAASGGPSAAGALGVSGRGGGSSREPSVQVRSRASSRVSEASAEYATPTAQSIQIGRASPAPSIGAASGGGLRGVRTRRATREASLCGPVCCAVCASDCVAEAPLHVARKNLLFPLSLLSFFAQHPPGTRFVDPEREAHPVVVPDYVQLLHVGGADGGADPPPMDLTTYLQCRKDEAWLAQPLPCCTDCSSELREVVARLKIGTDGVITVPPNPRALHPRKTRPQAMGRFAQPTTTSASHSRQATPLEGGSQARAASGQPAVVATTLGCDGGVAHQREDGHAKVSLPPLAPTGAPAATATVTPATTGVTRRHP